MAPELPACPEEELPEHDQSTESSLDSLEQLPSLDQRVQLVQENRIRVATRRMYGRNIQKFQQWLRVNGHSDQLRSRVDGTVELALDSFDVRIFLQFLESLRGNITFSTLSGYRSALNSAYRDQNLQFPADVALELNSYFTGAMRQQASEKESGLRKISEGKEAIPFGLLRTISSTMIRSSKSEDVFARVYMLFCWNLMCRTNNVENLCMSHFAVIGDALGVYLARQKNDQNGSRCRDPRHVYANPLDPVVCPLVALGMFFLTRGDQGNRLFVGGSQSGRSA